MSRGTTEGEGLMGHQQDMALQSPESELLEHLAQNNPHFQSLIDGLKRDITTVPFNPGATHYVVIAGETGVGKSTFAKHLGKFLKEDSDIQDWEQRNDTNLNLYHSAIGRTQRKLATARGIMPVVKGTIPRGNFTPGINQGTTEIMTNLGFGAIQYLDGPKVIFDDSLWNTAMYGKDLKTISGEEKGSLRFLRHVLLEMGGRLVIIEAEQAVQQEEVERRAGILAVGPAHAKDVLKAGNIIDDQETGEEIVSSAETSGNAASLAQARRIILAVAEPLIEEGVISPFYSGENISQMTLEERLEFFQSHPEGWLDFLSGEYNPVWVRRLVLKPDDFDFDPIHPRVFRLKNPKFPDTTITRHRFSKSAINTEDALAQKAAQSSSKILRGVVRNLGIKIPKP